MFIIKYLVIITFWYILVFFFISALEFNIIIFSHLLKLIHTLIPPKKIATIRTIYNN